MKNLSFLFILLILGFNSFCQQPKELNVEISYGGLNTKQESLNDYFQDSGEFFYKLYEESKVNRQINNVAQYTIGVNYQITNALGFGINVDHSFASLKIPTSLTFEPYPGIPDSNSTYYGLSLLRISSIGISVSSQIFFNKHLNFVESRLKIIRSLELYTRLSGGISFSRYEKRSSFNMADFSQVEYESKAFQGRAEIGIGYRFGKSIFSAIGMKVGYQYLKTNNVRNYSDNRLLYNTLEQPKYVSLDFSGIYYGVYLKFGK